VGAAESNRHGQFQPTRPRGARPCLFIGTDIFRVSTHAPTRGATATHRRHRQRQSFNPRAHEGRDLSTAKPPYIIAFQPTRPRGARLGKSKHSRPPKSFNPRAHEGRDLTEERTDCKRDCFNPRAHEGRDPEAPHMHLILYVSTHAPTRGATFEGLSIVGNILFQPTRPRGARPNTTYKGSEGRVSTHAPTRGATKRQIAKEDIKGRFNPRAHEGRDTCLFIGTDIFRVSTHAPTRGATLYYRSAAHNRGFNPRAHEGRDAALAATRPPTPRFNPRAHEGRDVTRNVYIPCSAGFNPRAHEGRDKNPLKKLVGARVSTHAPTRGATVQRK